MSNFRIHRLVLVAFIAIIAAATFAEELPAIVVTGHASQPQKPEILRMTMVLTGSGKDIRAAVAALKKVREDLRSKLTSTGADAAAIKFSDSVEGAGGGPLSFQQRMMQQALAAQQKNAPAAVNPPITVSSNITVEWPLPEANGGDDALIASNELIEKIKAVLPKADGTATPATKTAEEQEVAEEIAGQQNGAEAKPFIPTFLYVHKLTDAERSAAYTAAIADAKAQAGRLATAAGATLGSITRISTGTENQAENAMMAMMADNSGETTSATDESEAVSAQRSTVAFTTTLVTTFVLQANGAAPAQQNLGTK